MIFVGKYLLGNVIFFVATNILLLNLIDK